MRRRTADDFVHATLSLLGVPEDDLDQFAIQSLEVGQTYVERDRQTIYGFLGGLAVTARHQVAERLEDREAVTSGVLVPHDETAPLAHRRDDVGTLVAWALRFRDDPDTRPLVRELWDGIATQLEHGLRNLEEPPLGS